MFTYKGYTYQPWDDVEDDNIKTFHDVLTPEGKTISMPLSPYSRPSQKAFEKWVEIGCPQGSKEVIVNGFKSYHNWSIQDIDYAYSRKF